jgi:hypothetical protein
VSGLASYVVTGMIMAMIVSIIVVLVLVLAALHVVRSQHR